AEINSWGGLAKQFEVRADPRKLAKHRLTLDDLIHALQENNENVGGGYLAQGGESSLIQGLARAGSPEEIGSIVVASKDGIPVLVRDLGGVAVGHVIRRGGVTREGKGEAVLGLAFMRMGENSRDVTAALDRAMEDVRKALPAGVDVDVVY